MDPIFALSVALPEGTRRGLLRSVHALERRVALLEFARRHGASIIEDDYDGEYRYCAHPLDALHHLHHRAAITLIRS